MLCSAGVKLCRQCNCHKGRAAVRIFANQPIHYDLCICIPILFLLRVDDFSVIVKRFVASTRADRCRNLSPH